jgi:Spy/CpxP family protein refolding chaperone
MRVSKGSIHLTLFVVALAASAASATAQESKSQEKKAAQSKSDPVLAPRKAADTSKAAADFRRVPQYFGQVNLTPEQRENIYAIREKYARRQAQLEEELAGIRDSVLRDCEAVLTATQRNTLIELRGQAKAKASAKAKAKSKTKSEN